MTARKDGLKPTEELSGIELKHFAIQSADDQWHWAQAEIDSESVLVCAVGVDGPKHVRFGYQSNPADWNLYNKEGLPASPFTTEK